MKKVTISLFAAAILLHANEPYEITITSSAFQPTEKQAPFSTEIFTADDIKQSNASTIYEFLNEQSSINVMPASGNIYAQKLDMRGFGITDGYQNIVVTVDGQRLNNIDMTTQLLSSIPIDTIEKIEITKGSGSVKFGDGATAGTINIITKGKYQNKLTAFAGSNNSNEISLMLGYNTDKFIINGLWDESKTDGNRLISADGQTDDKSQTVGKLGVEFFPMDELELRANVSKTKIENKYANSMTQDQFDIDPSGLGELDWASQYYSENLIEVKNNSFGATYYLNNQNKILFDTINEDKTSDFITWKSDYETSQKNLQYNFETDSFKVAIGGNLIDSKRIGSTNETTKENNGYFASAEVSLNNARTLSFGARDEKVQYNYKSSIQNLSKDQKLQAYDIGYNQILNDSSSFFVNYNEAFQAPDIDRFFTYNFGTSAYEFNGYIKPATSKTINLGFNDFRDNNKLKITLFKSELENEIYYYAISQYSGINTNIDKSSKYGMEFFDRYKINETFFTSLNYSYVIAKIDSEGEGGGVYDGKTMPGVSKHNLTVNFGGDYGKTSFVLTHKYKSEAYNSEDFSNSATQKQKAYNSTNLSMNHKISNNLEIFANINNIFDVSNGFWVRNDTIFPTDFERTYSVGLNATF